ncbi:MAG TPA: hypothetical protein VFV94_20020 [Polyangiaceae bacterium]|jgi:hypothetical protein|nr:hypothetical protein [Polyangiaceae bacterium]
MDEFPTLEVVAFIGVLAALLGMLQLRTSLREIPKLSAALEAALRAGDLGGARALTATAEGAAFGRIGSALIEALDREPRPNQRSLEVVVAQARRRAAAAAQRGRARDLVVAAVLIGATAYAVRASLGVGRAFFGMLAAALVMTAIGPVLRRAMLDTLVRASDGLLKAAAAYLALQAAHRSQPCAECGALEALEIGAPALDSLAALGVRTLSVCRRCGQVSGYAEQPGSIAIDEARGVRLRAAEPELESSAEASEHEG